MEPHRFDALTKFVGARPSRRRLLRTLGGGGLLAGLGLAGGRAPWLVVAQAAPCTLTFTGTVRLGPSAGQLLAGGTTPGQLRGQLVFTTDQSGAISQGQLRLATGAALPVVGQVTGRALSLRLTGANQQVVVAVGTAAQDLGTCQGMADGLLTGPQPGDLGDWHATLSQGSAGGAAPAMAASGSPPPRTTTSAPTTSATTVVPGPTTTAAPTTTTTTTMAGPTTTPTTPAPAVACPAGQTACADACVDTGSDPNNCGACGHRCLPGRTCVGGSCAIVLGPPTTTVAPARFPPPTPTTPPCLPEGASCTSGLPCCSGLCGPGAGGTLVCTSS